MPEPIIIKNKGDLSDADALVSAEFSKEHLTKLINSLESLSHDVHFARYREMIILPKLLKKLKLLEAETDMVKIYRLQGAIEELHFASDNKIIESLLKNTKKKLFRT